MKLLTMIVLASATFIGTFGVATADQRTARLPNICTEQACTAPSILRLAQSQSPRCRQILEQCRAKCAASGPTRLPCLNRCGEAYESCN
jgi:hypothetical protein